MRNLGLGLVLIACVPASAAYAAAGGEIRDLVSATVGECPNAKLLEHYFEAGNIHGDAQTIEIACIASADKADWVWIAGYGCEGSKVCPKRKRKAPFASPQGHFLASKPIANSSPKTMTYNVERAVLGRNCALRSYKNDDAPEYFWDCESYKTSIAADGKFITVQTVGPTAQVNDFDEKAPKLPLNLTIASETYTVNEATALIDR